MIETNIKLSENDNKLLAFCYHRRQSVNEIAKFLNISPASISFKIKKLEKLGLIDIKRLGEGRRTYIRTRKGDQTEMYFFEILKELKLKGGDISQDEFVKFLPFRLGVPEDSDKFSAPLKLLFTPYVEKRVRITEEGEKFLKEKK